MSRSDDMRDALERLGGREAVTQRLDVTKQATDHWIKLGHFPYHRRVEIEALAREKLILLPEHLFQIGAKRGRKRKNAETQEGRDRDAGSRGSGRSLAASSE